MADVNSIADLRDYVSDKLGAVLLGGLHGQVAGRLERLLQLFERAQEGDFSGTYDESLDRMPDPITMVGRFSFSTILAIVKVLPDPVTPSRT